LQIRTDGGAPHPNLKRSMAFKTKHRLVESCLRSREAWLRARKMSLSREAE